jgi:hypothetical protein
VDDGGGGAGGGGNSDGSRQQLGAMAVAGNEWLWTSNPQLAKMADSCVNRNMTNIRKFGFSEYVFETRKNKINEKTECDISDIGNQIISLLGYLSKTK